MFRAVSKIVSCWVNAASGIAGESKVGSTFASNFFAPPAPQPVTTSLIFNIRLGKFTGDLYRQVPVVVESLKLTNKADRNQK